MVQTVARDKGLGLVSLTEVQVSPDLKHAQVYVTRLNSDHDPDMLTRELNSVAARFRGRLGKTLRLRTVPKLRFLFDESIERGAEMSALLNELGPADDPPAAAHNE